MKIGVLADTHIPDRRPALPSRVLEIFSTVEIVLHAGDITEMFVLQELLDQVSLTFAVHGDRDPMSVREHLPETQVLEFGGQRLGLIHGHRDRGTEFNATLRGLLRRGKPDKTLTDYLLSRFSDVNAIIFGHTHLPYAKMHGDVFLFNPGSIVPRRGEPSVGLIEIDGRGIRGRVLPL
jgi:putative phosphoesterase